VEFVGKTLREADLGRRFQVHVVGIRGSREESIHVIPPHDIVFARGQILIVIGSERNLAAVQEAVPDSRPPVDRLSPARKGDS
jgi:Trk K+ transport system NAD-binding subunit